MSGILGIFYRDGRPVELEYLRQMTQTLVHRGSDNTDVWLNESIGLGHCLRWTTPESLLDSMPLRDRSGNVITGDLRLDNRAELISSLDFARSDRFWEITDSELALAAYQRWGKGCAERLLGDFAFAIWSERSQQLFCARDHYGVKQLYYYCSDRLIVFATEIKTLFCLPEVPCRLNEVKVADYLLPLFEDREITFYQGIFRLPPAHYLVVDREQKQLKQYWSFDPAKNITLSSDREYAEAFRELFTEAVSCRLRSAFPVGTLLSGGLDSSSITCVTRDLLKQHQSSLHTFSAVFDRVTECDESLYINSVVKQGGIKSHLVRGDRFGPLSDWQQMTWHQDEAYYAPNLFLHCELYRAAQQQDVRILLDGFDGDTTVSHGIAYLAELTRSGNLLYLIPEVMGLANNFERSPWQMLWRHGLEPIVHPKVRRLGNKLIARKKSSQQPSLILQGDFARRIQLKQRLQRLRLGQLPKTSREAHYQRLTAGVMPFALEVADKAAAAFEIEPRYPFFDKRLTEFCLALPPEQKLHRGWTRIIMRRAMTGILPPKVQWRGGKSNLGANFQHGLQLGREKLEQVVYHDLTLIEDYVDLDSLRSLYQRFETGKDLSHDDFLAIWKSFSLALWLKDANLHT